MIYSTLINELHQWLGEEYFVIINNQDEFKVITIE